MPKIKSVQVSNTRYQLIEDPNPSFNRLFQDGQALDLNTLVPAWQKQFMYNIGGTQQYAGQNHFDGTFQDIQPALTRTNLATGFTDNFPVLDYGFFRIGYMALQKGTVSTYAVADGSAESGATAGGSGSTYSRSTLQGQYDTYWWSLDFANYPVVKSWKSPVTGYCHMIYYPKEILNNDTTTIGWGTWLSDLTQGINNTSNNSALFINTHNLQMNMFCWEDTNFGVMYGMRKIGGQSQRAVAVQGFNFGNTYSFTTSIVAPGDQSCIFFMGVDSFGFTWWYQHQDQRDDSRGFIYKIDPRNLASTTMISALTSQSVQTTRTSGGYKRNWPSNIRRDANNRYVLYTSHFDNNDSQLAPMRIVWDAANGTVNTANCNMVFPVGQNYRSFASPMAIPVVDATGFNNHTWMMKPHQFTSNGNTYITYWLVDQFAWPSASLSGTYQTYYSSNGNIRWANTAQRTMVTYQIAANSGFGNPLANSDATLIYHSNYTFSTVLDIPKNFMPINANNTLMAVVSGSKTNFFAWNNQTGWASGGVYNTEFRMLGMDTTNRIWGYAMDENNGSLHVLTPSLSVNVVIQMASVSYTYTGTTISTSATINAYDFTGSRVAANVTLTIDGTTMTFAQNGLRTLNIQTSSTIDTTVNLSIFGGGVNNIYAYA